MKKLIIVIALTLVSNSFVAAQDCSGMTDYPDLVEVCNAPSQFFPDAAELLFPFDFFNCFADPEIDNGDGTITVVAFDVFNSVTGNYIGSLYESQTLGRIACLDLTIVVPLNETCDPIEYQFEIVTSINVIDVASNTTLSSVVDPNCTIETMAAIHYPVLTVSATDAECPNDVVATLSVENGGTCFTETQTCTAEGPVNFDFSGSVADPQGCSDLTATASCTNCGPPCTAEVSTISTTDNTRICVDGVPDPIDVTIDVDGGGTGVWVVTDPTGFVFATYPGSPFDFDNAGPGICLIWYVNSDDPNIDFVFGDDVSTVVANTPCSFLSNSIAVDRIEVTAATISTADPLTICIDDGIDEPINVNIDNAGIGANGAWVITDATGTIVALPAAPPFILDGAGVGTCSIWWVNYDDPAFAPAVGDDAAAIVAASTCAALSNPITIERENCGTPCSAAASTISTTDPTRICIDGVADPINVTVDTDGGGTGAWVITDAAGIILALPASPPFDLDGAGAGQCLIWYVNYDDVNFAPTVGDDAATIVAASSCAFLSNAITVDRIEVTGATIVLPNNGTSLTICVDDDIETPIPVNIFSDGIGANGVWVITDSNGIILDFPADPTAIILDGAGVGTCQIWLVTYDDANFAPAVGDDLPALATAASCAALSNPITVNRENCDTPCSLTMGSTISTTDPTRICVDGVGDPINVSVDVDAGGTGVWVITDAAGIILAFPPGPPFDLDGAGAGQCLIWYVNTEDGTFNPMIGDDAAAAVAASDCTFLSNAIIVDRIEVTGATILLPNNADFVTICTNDGIDEPLNVNLFDGIGANGAWIITDSNGIILALPSGPPFVLDGAGPGTCLIWWVNFDDPNFAPAVGDDAAALVAAATCAALSNPITVTRDDNCGPCEDAIEGSVSAEDMGCSPAGIEVTIYDSTGAIVGTTITDANGNYALMGLYPCGSYSAELTANVPDCYANSGGITGPINFEVDGDGTADGVNFMENPQVPTLSQWGLISLALLLMVIGSLKMSATQVILKRFRVK